MAQQMYVRLNLDASLGCYGTDRYKDERKMVRNVDPEEEEDTE